MLGFLPSTQPTAISDRAIFKEDLDYQETVQDLVKVFEKNFSFDSDLIRIEGLNSEN